MACRTAGKRSLIPFYLNSQPAVGKMVLVPAMTFQQLPMRSTDSAYKFGPFTLHPAGRSLLQDGISVGVGARALDILILLVERAGEFVSKEELFRSVWPDTFVEETSLRVHIAALRKALGGADARYIENAPGKGYRFTGEVIHVSGERRQPFSKATRASRHELPFRLTRMIGRAEAVEAISSLLLTKRFVTITGEGGVGKTTLSLAVAEAVRNEYQDGIVFVDLAAASYPSEVGLVAARALGFMLAQDAPLAALGEAIGNQALLMVVDNCEHMVKESALLVGEMLRACPSLRVLATSREALRTDAEQVYRLESLPTPCHTQGITAAEALRYESVQLLVERVSASADGFVLTDSDAKHAAELCRALDGVPLAIELAAARVSFFGLHGLLMRLPDRLRILTAGHRTVMPRHQTLRALYDWSYELLEEEGKVAFARLAVFPGSFSLDGAMTLMQPGDKAKTLTVFLNLVAKSLVASDLGVTGRRYRLLDTARVYAMEKLEEFGLTNECKLAYAEFLIRTLDVANEEWVREKGKEWIDRYSPLAEDVGSALRWLRDQPDHTLTFAQLTVSSFQLALQLAQLDAYTSFVEPAIERLDQMEDAPVHMKVELVTIYGTWIVMGCPEKAVVDAWLARVQILLDAGVAQGPLLCVLCVTHIAHGEYRRLLRNAQHLEAICEAQGETQAVLIARRMQAQARHFLGDYTVSKQIAKELLAYPGGQTLRYGRYIDNMDRRISLGIVLARTAWLEGRATEAQARVKSLIDFAGPEHEFGRSHLLALAAIPIAIWCGQPQLAAERLDELRFLITRHAIFVLWSEWVTAYEALLSIGTLFQPVRSVMLLDHIASMSTSFHDDRLLQRVEAGAVGWVAPEVIRGYGCRLLDGQVRDVAKARERFRQALEMAKAHGSLRWQLKAASSLAELDIEEDNPGDAERQLLIALAEMPADLTDPDVARGNDLVETLRQRAGRMPVLSL